MIVRSHDNAESEKNSIGQTKTAPIKGDILPRDVNEMKKSILIILMLLSSSGYSFSAEYKAQDGDIIFQSSRSSQSIAIQRATKSKYSHMGIVYIRNGEAFVYETIEPVMLTPFGDWVARGDGGKGKGALAGVALGAGRGGGRLLRRRGRGFGGREGPLPLGGLGALGTQPRRGGPLPPGAGPPF